MKPYFIHAQWDGEAGVWTAISEDVPGLAAESHTVEALVLKLKVLVPELLDANGIAASGYIPFGLVTRCACVAHAV